MINVLTNQITQEQIDTSNIAFMRFILAIQQDDVDRANMVQSSDITRFPEVPSFGGIFTTRKGAYEGIYTDAAVEVGQWRRITDNSIHAVGAVIPITL
jgi:hypothetical protein